MNPFISLDYFSTLSMCGLYSSDLNRYEPILFFLLEWTESRGNLEPTYPGYKEITENLKSVRTGEITMSDFVQRVINCELTLDMVSCEAKNYLLDLVEYDIYIELLTKVYRESLDSLPRDLDSSSTLYLKLDEYYKNYKINKKNYPEMVSVLPPLEFKKIVEKN